MKQIKILAVNDPAVYAYVRETENAITKTWEEANQVKVIIDIIDWDQYKNTLDVALKNREGNYDIMMNPGNFWLPELVEKQLIIPLDEYLDDYDLNGIIESVQDEMKYNDHIYISLLFQMDTYYSIEKIDLKRKGSR
ncbi:extracellular solute-binding protein [Tepidibacillus infernus]|uniref:Periplasmic binding protein domain-containing protein n=1 Tax=Tepidibacillus decaturensis TaxID=1413211 RepID=A0A135L6H3_9BACI|nr:extracellular solute-binding protein [Tepidibacillus decaturensis]KXG44595.1 hypothetical protein U473_11625 [Tepidibacillus decaturensis]